MNWKKRNWLLLTFLSLLLFTFVSGGGGCDGSDNQQARDSASTSPAPDPAPEPSPAPAPEPSPKPGPNPSNPSPGPQPSPDELTRDDLDELIENGVVDVYQDLRTARVQFIGGDDLSAIFPDPIHSAEEAITALRRVRSLLGVANPSEEFVAGNAQSNGEIFSYKLQQTYRGVPVYSEEIVVATDPDGMIHTLASTYQPIDGSLSATPDLTRDDAETIARNALESEIAAARDDAPSVNITLSSELVVYAPDGRAPELSWRVTAYDTWIAKDYFINQSGIIVDSFSLLCGAAENVAASGVDDLGVSRAFRSSKVSDDKFELFDMERKIKTYGINNPSSTATLFTSANNTWSDRVAVSAHYNTAVVYDFYKNILNRTSIDGAGMEIKSTVHLNEDNAWWHPVAKQMFYGDGITTFRPLARGMDVVGHELTHGVIQHTPANLTYISESGALNEAYADILGNLIEGKTGADAWLLGEDVTLATAALRDMANPTRFGQPMEVSGDHYWNPQNTSWDNGGVHRNSGIINRAAYLMWSDGHFTREEFAKLWYSSLSLMTSNSKFIHCRYAIAQIARLFHMSEDQKQSIRRAFDAVKIGVPPVIIELRWGYAPRDLDSHLTGPTVDGSGRFHIYFSNKTYTADSETGPAADLDRDDIDSFGPEFTTIRALTPGTYRFYVHDYTNRYSTSSSSMSASGAKVKITYPNAREARTTTTTFSVLRGAGTLWTVFTLTIDETSSLVEIQPVNTMSFAEVPDSIGARSVGGLSADPAAEDLRSIQSTFFKTK